MAIVHVHGLFVPFTLLLEDDGHVDVTEDLPSLKFNLWIGTLYVEPKMYIMEHDISRTILMQNNRSKDVMF